MRNLHAKALHEGRGGHYASRVIEGEKPARKLTKQQLLEQVLMQEDILLDEDFDDVSEGSQL